ncbi:MAG: hypothetical protein IPO27_18295 [Bacteroidetes bacterium]|nr:hypothetical protein [Bacteroidota bacterium]
MVGQKHRNAGYFNKQSIQVFVSEGVANPVIKGTDNELIKTPIINFNQVAIEYRHTISHGMSVVAGVAGGFYNLNFEMDAKRFRVNDTLIYQPTALRFKKDLYYYGLHAGIYSMRYIGKRGRFNFGSDIVFQYHNRNYPQEQNVFSFPDQVYNISANYLRLNSGYGHRSAALMLRPGFTFDFILRSKNYVSIGLYAGINLLQKTQIGAYEYLHTSNINQRYGKLFFNYNYLAIRLGYAIALDSYSMRGNYLRNLRSTDKYQKLKWRNDKQLLSDRQVLTLNAYALSLSAIRIAKPELVVASDSLSLFRKRSVGVIAAGEHVINTKAPFDVVIGLQFQFNNNRSYLFYHDSSANADEQFHIRNSNFRLNQVAFVSGLEFKWAIARRLNPLIRFGAVIPLIQNPDLETVSLRLIDEKNSAMIKAGNQVSGSFAIAPFLSAGVFRIFPNKDMITFRAEYLYQINAQQSIDVLYKSGSKTEVTNMIWKKSYVAVVVAYYFNKSNMFRLYSVD